jgi:hypothetical protein
MKPTGQSSAKENLVTDRLEQTETKRKSLNSFVAGQVNLTLRPNSWAGQRYQ